MNEIYPQTEIYKLKKNPVPIYEARPNEKIRIHTLDCFGNRLKPGGNFRDLIYRGGNPITGPIQIAGAKAGDVLQVTIEKIQCADTAFVTCGSGFGVLAAEKLKDTHAYYSIKDGIISGPNLYNVPACPIIGTIGTWPKKEHLTVEPGYYGGNLDTIYITQGSILYLPVNIDGGMFFAGDIHALQGAGETHGGGMECAGKIDVTFSVIKNISFPTPLIKTSEEIIVLATDINFDKAMQQAAGKMVSVVQQLNDLSKEDALIYCSVLGHLRIGQVVNPRKTAAFALNRRYLKKEII